MNIGPGLGGHLDATPLSMRFPHDLPKPGEAGYARSGPNACRLCGMTTGTACSVAATLALQKDIARVFEIVERVEKAVDLVKRRLRSTWSRDG